MANEWREKELEDYIVANPQAIGQHLHMVSVNKAELVYLGRQVKCEVGIIDLLFHANWTIYVVELKAVRATAKELGQVLRYADYIQENLYDFVHVDKATYFNALIHRFVYSNIITVVPVLVATDFDTMAASLIHVHTLKATKTNSGFVIDGIWANNPTYNDQDLYRALAPYAEYIRQQVLDKARFDAEKEARQSVERRLTDVN